MLRVLKVLEMAWLAIGIFSLTMGAYQYNTNGWEPAQWFFIGALMSGIFFTFRRRQRLKFEREEAEKTDKDAK
ncbi:MAG: hypothetical protein JKX84_06485 [Flavobacteriales bacterium]|nr:hypothetical protein [Flavobacteriales bacterium]